MPKNLNPAPKDEWWDKSWNPVTGCLHTMKECACADICYARKLARRFGKTEDEKNFKPAFHPERLDAPSNLKKPSRIFLCSMGDLFGQWVPKEWIEAIIKAVYDNPQHKFFFLTKNPSHYLFLFFPSNAWLGMSINSIKDLNRNILIDNERNPSVDLDRIYQLLDYYPGIPIHYSSKNNTFISFEPILDKITYDDLGKFDWSVIKWIIIGGFSGRKMDENSIISTLEIKNYFKSMKIPIFEKPNLGLKYFLKQFPEGLKIAD